MTENIRFLRAKRGDVIDIVRMLTANKLGV